jgi:DNA-binding NtrC family response regulator
MALADADSITALDLPEHVRAAPAQAPRNGSDPAAVDTVRPPAALDLRRAMLEHEQALILRALQQTDGNRRKAARLLSLPLRTLERKVSRLTVDWLE